MGIINIYTDGACSGNQNESNVGGWGALLEYGQHTKEIFGGELNTTNNRMEMTALIKALEAITKTHQTIRVFSDSSYLVDCFNKKWYLKWKENGWKTSKKTDVDNRDLWEALLKLIETHDVSFFRVKGHVNLESSITRVNPLYNKFTEWNGPLFTKEDFISITNKNNHADLLANKGIETLKDEPLE